MKKIRRVSLVFALAAPILPGRADEMPGTQASPSFDALQYFVTQAFHFNSGDSRRAEKSDSASFIWAAWKQQGHVHRKPHQPKTHRGRHDTHLSRPAVEYSFYLLRARNGVGDTVQCGGLRIMSGGQTGGIRTDALRAATADPVLASMLHSPDGSRLAYGGCVRMADNEGLSFMNADVMLYAGDNKIGALAMPVWTEVPDAGVSTVPYDLGAAPCKDAGWREAYMALEENDAMLPPVLCPRIQKVPSP